MTSVANALEAILLSVQNGEDFGVSSIDHSALTITCVVLWMYKNHGRNDMQAIDVEPLMHSILCGHTQLQIVRELDLVAADFAQHGNYNAGQMVRRILECCDLVWRAESVYRNVPYLHNSDAVVICKRKLALLLYDALSSVQTSDTYGVFYKRLKCSKVHGITGNVLTRNRDGTWDNHGRALFWYISRWDIPASKVSVGPDTQWLVERSVKYCAHMKFGRI